MNSTNKQYITSMIIIGVLFFLFGFITWLNGILIPYLKIACELNNLQSLMVASSFYIAYFVMAIPSGWVLNKTGFKNGMMVGLWIMAIGALIFIPAALTRSYPIFLIGLFILGTGLTVLQTSSNPYITIIGPVETAASRISIMGICNKIAGALAPLILAYFILSDGDSFVNSLASMSLAEKNAALDALAARAIAPYSVIAISLFLLGIMMRFSPLPEIEREENTETDNSSNNNEVKSIFQLPHLWMGVIALFFYVGAEVIAGDTIIRYGMLLGIDIAVAKAFTSYTLVAMVVGYILIGLVLIPKVISQRTALILSALLGITFTLAAIFTSGTTSVFFIVMLGFANAIVWPAIWPLAIHNTGKHIKTASSLLIMAIAGGATLPLVWGAMADYFANSPQNAYWICVPCYLMIFYFGMWGYKLKPIKA
ncbi:MAG: glucose/galactose MFS transporter [Bacteroidetes bacterium GWF2_33_16]|nr:MAG: glucose/galactose MFS transporter [Bacteroidetes bacterium GWE2_32_14]OFY07087.1 MAG: glucose/galactose MFS transporter [Bacteroidetes bacterium GWF2_33_16]